MNDKVCENCKWYKEINMVTGECRRFPQWVKKLYHHYCGEWKDKNDD